MQRAKSACLVAGKRLVSLRMLKRQVAESLPPDLKTVQLILQERDELPSEEFLVKSDMWTRLLEAEIKDTARTI